MERTPSGTSVGVGDPYAHAGHCDHLTGDGRCRFAVERFEDDPSFARKRREDDYRCPAVDPDGWDWSDCPNYRSTATDRTCRRCGLEERYRHHDEAERPLLEEHHLSYPSTDCDHEITVTLCRWCHAKVHTSWAAITDDVSPDPEALAEREARRSEELDECAFDTAANRYDPP